MNAEKARALRGEDADLRVGGVLAGAAVIVSGIALAAAAGWLVVALTGVDAAGPNAAARGRSAAAEAPQPRLETAPREDLARFLSGKRRRLESYGWIDRDRGLVHIPIERAMHRLVEEARKAPPAGAAAGQRMPR